MNEIFFITALLISVYTLYNFFIVNNRKKTLIGIIIIIKVIFLWSFATGSFAEILPALIPMAGIMLVFAGGTSMINISVKAKENRGRYFFILAVLFLLAVFGSGCTSNDSKKPEIIAELKLNFTPSVINSPENDVLYVASERGKSITVFDMQSLNKKTTISTGYMPVDILFSNNKMYTANKSSNTVTIHNLETGVGKTINSGGAYPCSLAINLQKNRLYVANLGSNNVAVLDLGAPTITVVKTIAVGKWPSDLYLSPDLRYLYVCCKYTNTIQVIDAEKEQPVFTKVNTGISPSKMVALSKSRFAIINEWEYAFNHQSTILIFNRINYNLEYDIMVEGGIFDALLSKNKRFLYVSVPMKDKIIFVDIKRRQTVFELDMPGVTPKWLALSKDGKILYAAGSLSKKIYTISLDGIM